MGGRWGLKFVSFYKFCKNAFFFILFLGMFCLCLSALRDASLEQKASIELETLPDYNYIPDIQKLREEGRLTEALAIAKFVIAHPQLPGQQEAKQIEEEISREQSSRWGKAKRFSAGFIKGSSESGEELAGAIASDLVLWGDVRDLAQQGYLKFRGEETDPLLAGLAGVGLLTEVVDAADWAPAVLKAFRKLGALSERFTSYLVRVCKKSIKSKSLDAGLGAVFSDLKLLGESLGSARTVEVFRHVDDPESLAALAKVSRKNPDAVYLTVKNAGPDGVEIIQQLGDSDEAVAAMASASKKGPKSITWLQRGGKGHKYVVKTRLTSRLAKNIHVGRLYALLKEIAKLFPWGIRIAAILSLAISLLFIFRSKREWNTLKA